ncbi:MAG: VanW family protein [Bacillota bacterium]|jgi:vancomycin resistance protein YoaR
MICILLAVLLSLFAFISVRDFCWQRSERLPLRVTFYGEDLSNNSFEQAKRTIYRLVEDKGDDVVTVTGEGRSFDFFRRDLGYPLDGARLFLEAKSLGREGGLFHRLAFRFSALWRETPLEDRIAVDEIKLGRALRAVSADLGTTARDAAFVIDGEGQISVSPSRRGSRLDTAASANGLRAALRAASDAPFPLVIEENAEPKVTTAELKAMKIDGLLASFTTYYSEDAANRARNITLAASYLDMTLIPAGETFSFNRAVGRRSRERGFLDAAIIENGAFTDGLGGGVCQVSTTVYGAALRTKMKIRQRRPHSLVSAYVEPGQDAMVSWGTSDLVFLNTYKTPVLLHAAAEGGSLTVSVYGDSAERADISVVTEILGKIPFEIENVADSALPQGARYTRSPGKEGLECAVYRVYRENGAAVRREFVSRDTYLAQKRVVVFGP